MATPPDAVRGQLAVVTATASAELAAVAAEAPQRPVEAAMDALGLIVPAYYDAAGSLATAWYEERREESSPSTLYVPQVIGDPTTDWIEREVAQFAATIEVEVEAEMQRMLDEINRLAEKEVARGFRDSMLGNARMDEEAVGWSRVARPDGCPFCRMLAAKGAIFTEATANFAAHLDCNCAVRPEFRNGEHGPEADVLQYVASLKRRTPEQQTVLKQYLHENFGAPQPRETRGQVAEPRQAGGFENLTREQVELQIRITEQLKPSEWRDRQLARLRTRLRQL